MKVLNLVDYKASDIKYNLSDFPDGQRQVSITGIEDASAEEWRSRNGYFKIQINARLNNFEDLELIICATKSLRSLGVKDIYLYVPYFLGSRSDRAFIQGENNYLKDVICPIINSLKFTEICVMDPHSDVLEACLDNYRKLDNYKLVQFAVNCINNFISGETAYLKQDKFILTSPDAGASKKIYKIAEKLQFGGEILTCSKDRDENGKLTKCSIPISSSDQLKKDFIIIDDICDGGGTFINIAKAIKFKGQKVGITPKIYLIVTHGIFSRGFGELTQHVDGIYCTNSYKDIPEGNEAFIKQLNVF